jgi:NAD(P)H dehydrogenase (quinone)
MKHLIVFAHPHSGSFNHAILETAVNALKNNGHEVTVRDLYKLDFQPVLKAQDTSAMRDGIVPDDIKAEQEYIAQADAVTLIYPIWWTGMPAILKGYIDRIFSYGFAYAVGSEGIIKLLKGKKGLIINTHGTSKEVYEENGVAAGLKATSDTGIFDFTGIEPVEHLLFGSVPYVDDAVRKDMLKTVENTINAHFPR